MKETDDAYVDAARAAISRGEPVEVLQYLTITCTECGNYTPSMDDDERALHALHGDYVLVGCEGYRMIDPNLLGIDAPGWDDWTAYNWEVPT